MSEQESIIKIAAEAGAKAAMQTLERERAKANKVRRDSRLRNTKLLIKNYRVFKQHSQNAVYRASQIEESAIEILDLMWDPNNSKDAMIESIKRSAIRTNIIMKHIDEMLDIYGYMVAKSDKPEDKRRERVLRSMYILDTPMTTERIATDEGIDTRTVYKDIDAACEKLSALIFGVDWLASKE